MKHIGSFRRGLVFKNQSTILNDKRNENGVLGYFFPNNFIFDAFS